MAIRDILDHYGAKLGDRVTLTAPETFGTFVNGTLFSAPTDSGTLTLTEVDPGTGALGTVVFSGTPDGTHLGENFWLVTLSGTGFKPKTYYRAEVTYSGTGPIGELDYHRHSHAGISGTHSGTHSYMLHVNDEFEYIENLKRSIGLAGRNIRKTGWVYRVGNVVEFTASLYRSSTDVDAAEAGTADNPFAKYLITVTYDQRYNRTKIERVRTL